MSINQLKQLAIRDSSLNLRCESLLCNSFIIPQSSIQTFNLAAPVSQTVSLSGTHMMINVASFVAAPQQYYYYNFNSPDLGTNDVIRATLVNMNTDIGTAGIPVLQCYNRSGVGRLYIINVDTTLSHTSTYQIYVEIIKIQ